MQEEQWRADRSIHVTLWQSWPDPMHRHARDQTPRLKRSPMLFSCLSKSREGSGDQPNSRRLRLSPPCRVLTAAADPTGCVGATQKCPRSVCVPGTSGHTPEHFAGGGLDPTPATPIVKRRRKPLRSSPRADGRLRGPWCPRGQGRPVSSSHRGFWGMPPTNASD